MFPRQNGRFFINMKKEIQEFVVRLLELINDRFPTKKCKHNLQLGENGFLWLWIYIESKGVWQSIIFDTEYNNETPEQITDGIVKNLKEVGYEI